MRHADTGQTTQYNLVPTDTHACRWWTPHKVLPVTPHGYAKFDYVSYAKHGYSTWLCRIWLVKAQL